MTRAERQRLECRGASTPGEAHHEPARERNDDHEAVEDAHFDSML